jgi:hypothetical protein
MALFLRVLEEVLVQFFVAMLAAVLKRLGCP